MKRNYPPKEKYEMTFEWNKQRLKIPVKQKRHHNLEAIKKFTLSSNIWSKIQEQLNLMLLFKWKLQKE